MKNLKVIIESIASSDETALKGMQKKINQWMTTGLLVKYELHTCGDNVIFNICVRKKGE